MLTEWLSSLDVPISGILFEDPSGDAMPWEMAEMCYSIRSVMQVQSHSCLYILHQMIVTLAQPPRTMAGQKDTCYVIATRNMDSVTY
jgi:hypothetical protein